MVGNNSYNIKIMNIADYNDYRLGLAINREAISCEFIIKDGKGVICDWTHEGNKVELPQTINSKTKKSFFNKLAIILLKYLCEQFPDEYLSRRIKNDQATAVVEVFRGDEWYGYLTSKIAADKIL